jgi:hypothetical protein
MSNTTFPSSPVTFVDIPEVVRFDAHFKYSFFTPDESLDFSQQRQVDGDPARCVTFEFSPVDIDGRLLVRRRLATALRQTEHDLTSAIMEHDLTSTRFVGVRFQDTQLDGKLTSIVSGAVVDRIARHNAGVTGQFNATAAEIDDVLHRGTVNLFDVAKLMSGEAHHVSNDDDASIVARAASRLTALNASFIDEAHARERIDRQFERITDVGIDVQLNAKFIDPLITSVVTDPVSIHADEVADLVNSSRATQDEARRIMNSTGIDASEYEMFVEPTSVRAIDVKSFTGMKRIVGYVIDKYEVASDGTHVVHHPIVVTNPVASHAVDIEISYGRRYIYTVRTIAEVEFTTVLNGQNVAATLLISSRPGIRRVIDTVEHVPPPPPADFSVKWDHASHAPRLVWSFPVNRQRDIKTWRVFRRRSIAEPFELIREIDFDDSVIKVIEHVDLQIVDFVSGPINFHIDAEFNTAGEFIYTVCTVDAHGLMSNYSTQFIVRFDVGRSHTVTKLISIAGAPASYPNMYVTQDDVIVDIIADSHHNQVDVFFDPDALSLVRGKIRQDLVTSGDAGLYKLQFINVDLQQTAAVDIVIRNALTTRPV